MKQSAQRSRKRVLRVRFWHVELGDPLGATEGGSPRLKEALGANGDTRHGGGQAKDDQNDVPGELALVPQLDSTRPVEAVPLL